MAQRKMLIGAVAAVSALTLVVASAPAQVAKPVTRASIQGASPRAAAPSAAPSLTEAETNEQVVAHFLKFKERAEKAQRAILADYRKQLDLRRAEFEEARRRFEEARGRYTEIVGPLPTQGIMNPEDPRLPYEFEVRRLWPLGVGDSKEGQMSRQPSGGTVR